MKRSISAIPLLATRGQWLSATVSWSFVEGCSPDIAPFTGAERYVLAKQGAGGVYSCKNIKPKLILIPPLTKVLCNSEYVVKLRAETNISTTAIETPSQTHQPQTALTTQLQIFTPSFGATADEHPNELYRMKSPQLLCSGGRN